MKALQVATSEISPAEELWAAVEPYLDDIPLITDDNILVAIYKRREKTKGGIYLPGATLDEDVWQGKVGLILKMGPLAYKEDDKHTYPAGTPKIKDWVVFRVGDAWPLALGETPCRITTEKAIRMVITRPDIVL